MREGVLYNPGWVFGVVHWIGSYSRDCHHGGMGRMTPWVIWLFSFFLFFFFLVWFGLFLKKSVCAQKPASWTGPPKHVCVLNSKGSSAYLGWPEAMEQHVSRLWNDTSQAYWPESRAVSSATFKGEDQTPPFPLFLVSLAKCLTHGLNVRWISCLFGFARLFVRFYGVLCLIPSQIMRTSINCSCQVQGTTPGASFTLHLRVINALHTLRDFSGN